MRGDWPSIGVRFFSWIAGIALCPQRYLNVEGLADRRRRNGVCDNQRVSWRGVLKEAK
jgi:hypothetical protein